MKLLGRWDEVSEGESAVIMNAVRSLRAYVVVALIYIVSPLKIDEMNDRVWLPASTVGCTI